MLNAVEVRPSHVDFGCCTHAHGHVHLASCCGPRFAQAAVQGASLVGRVIEQHSGTHAQVLLNGIVMGRMDRNGAANLTLDLSRLPASSPLDLGIIVEAVGRANEGWRYDVKGLKSPLVTLHGETWILCRPAMMLAMRGCQAASAVTMQDHTLAVRDSWSEVQLRLLSTLRAQPSERCSGAPACT